MSIVTQCVYRVTSWDAEQQAVVERVFSGDDVDALVANLKAIHDEEEVDEYDILWLIKHLYYGAPYYEIGMRHYTYRQTNDTDSADATPGDNNTVQLNNEALYAIRSKLSPITYGKMATLNLFDQKPAYQYADIFPMTAAMRAIDESIKTGNAEPWVPTIRKAMSPRVSRDMEIPNIWLTEVNAVTSIVMAQNSGRWSTAWLNTRQYELLNSIGDNFMVTIIDENTQLMYPDRLSFDALMLSRHEHKVKLADKLAQPDQVVDFSDDEINGLRELLHTRYEGDAYAYIDQLYAIVDRYHLEKWVWRYKSTGPSNIYITLDNGLVLVVGYDHQLLCYNPAVNENHWYWLTSSRILTQQLLADPAVTRLLREQPYHHVGRALYINRDLLDLGVLDDALLVQWAQQIRNIYPWW